MITAEYALGYGATTRLYSFTLTYADVTAAAATQSITLFTLSKHSKILGVTIKHSTAFSGGAISAMTVSVGDAGSATAYASAFNVFQASGATVFQDSASYKSVFADTAILATFTATGANVSAATAGQVEIQVYAAQVSTP